MSIAETLYAAAAGGARAASPLLARGDSKLARSLRGRRGVVARLVEWARAERDTGRRLVWIHAPSVGEGLQARAVLSAVLERRPELQSVFTHFSPSAEGLARSMPVDVADYLPWDVTAEVDPVLKALRPDLVVFTKTEVWPVLTRSARRRGVPTALVAATLPKGSSRLRWPTTRVLRPALGRLAAVLAIAREDAERFRDLGARRERVHVTGDPGIDSAAVRAGAADPAASYLAPFADDPRPTLVAGSTWPPDESVVVEAVTTLREEHPGLRLVVAPHEPGEAHVGPLERALEERGWRTARLDAVEGAGSVRGVDAVVVDRVGVLAHLYTVGSVAYVGGGFHGAGLHSVLEPAAAGVPVTFGPRHGNSRAASDLLEEGGAREVDGAPALVRALRSWLSDESTRARWGRAARGYIESHRGAAGRTAERLLGIMGGS